MRECMTGGLVRGGTKIGGWPRWLSLDPRPAPSWPQGGVTAVARSEEHTSELQSQSNLVCRLLLEKKNINHRIVKDCTIANAIIDAYSVGTIKTLIAQD